MQVELLYVECPNCKKWHAHSELTSYPILGNLECWSDGKCIRDETLEYSSMPFSKCTKCENFFWFEDCRKIEDYEIRRHIDPPNDEFVEKQLVVEFLKENLEDYQENNLDLNYPPSHWYWGNISALLIEDFIKILENTDNLLPDKEIYIRTKLWHYINDLVRFSDNFFMQILKNDRKKTTYNKTQYKEYEKTRLENLIRLAEQLRKVEEVEYEASEISLIEIERELGHFDKAKLLIENIDPINVHKNKVFIKKSLELITKKSTKVFIVN